MKRIISLSIFLITAVLSFGQVGYTPEAARQFTYVKVDSGFVIAFRDTTLGRGVDRPGAMVVRPQDSLFYGYNGHHWERFGKNLASTSNKVDSVTISGDTLYYWINGSGYGWLLPNNAAWKTTGNVGVCDMCFLGTLDAADLIFKVDNTESGRLTNTGGTAFGFLSEADTREGTAIGHNAKSKNPQSTAIGAGTEAQSDSSTALGYGAISSVNHGVVLGDSNRAKVGIGTAFPEYKLDVRGQVRIKDGTEGAGKVLTSDATGATSWTTVTGTGTVTNVGTGYGLSGGAITTTGVLVVDTATLSGKYVRVGDTTSMLYPYLRKHLAVTDVYRRADSVFLTINSAEVFAYKDSTGGSGGVQTLQDVFNQEYGSQLTKADTIITHGASNNGLSLKVTARGTSYAAMSTNPYGFNVFSDNERYTRIQDGQMIQKGAYPFLAQLDRAGKITNSIGYDSTYDHSYIDRADSIDFVIEDNSYYNMFFVARHSRKNPTYKGGIFVAPLSTDFVNIGNAATHEPYSGDKLVVFNNARFHDTLKLSGVLKATGLPTAKKSQILYFDPSTKMVSVGDSSVGGADTSIINNLISDSLNANALYIKNPGSGADSLAQVDGDTLKILRPVGGDGIILNTTSTAVNWRVDSAKYATRLRVQKAIDSLGALIGGGSQTPWTDTVDAAHYGLKNLSKLSVYRAIVSGGGGTTENMLLYSEVLTNGAWSAGVNTAVTDNQANDLEGNNTLEELNCTFAGSNTVGQTLTGLTSGATYYVSWDVKLPGSGAVTDVYYQFYDLDHFANISNNSYFGSVSTTLSRYSTSFTVPSGCTQVIIRPFGDNSTTGKILIGRVQVATNASYTYIETTGSAAGPSGGGGGTTYDSSFVVDTTGKIYINPAHTATATSDSALFNSGSSGELKRVLVKNIYNSNGTITPGDREVDGTGVVMNWNSFDAFNIHAVNVGLYGINGASSNVAEVLLNRDSILIRPSQGKLFIDSLNASTSHTDSILVKSSTGQIKAKAQNTVGRFIQTVATDANITAVDRTIYHLPSATLSANRTIDVSGLVDGDEIQILNNEAGFTWSFTGASVYLIDQTTTVTAIATNSFSWLKMINGKITIIN